MLALLATTSPSYILLSSIDSDLEGKIKIKISHGKIHCNSGHGIRTRVIVSEDFTKASL